MATLPTPDENARVVLDIYKHFGTQPGEVILKGNLVAMAAAWDLRLEDVVAGIERAYELGWVEGGPNDSFKLTDAGFAAI